MAGSTLQITTLYDDREVRAVLDRLVERAVHMEPVFREIGEYLDLAHRERWDKQQAPDGTPWEPLSESTLRRAMLGGVKRGKGARRKRLTQRQGGTKAGAIGALARKQILVESGDLRDLLRYEASDTGLEFGTDRPYGATHQFGRPEDGIHARPWLGLSERDKQVILELLREHLERAMEGR